MRFLKTFNFYTIIKFFFGLIFVNYFYFSTRLSLRENSWIAGDWLMNYEAGIVRRGLSGEFILLLKNITTINVTYILIFIQTILFGFFLYLFYKILKKKQINLLICFLIFSPVTFLFSFYDPLTVGRKEIIFILFYTYYISNLEKNKIPTIMSNLIYFIIGLTFVLIHEIFIFFSTFFLFTKFFYLSRNILEKKIYKFSNEFLLLIGCAIGIILLVFFSSENPNIKELICNRLLENGLTDEICKGALNEVVFSKYLHSYKGFGIIDYIINYNYLKTYSISLLMFFTPLTIFFYLQRHWAKDIQISFIFLISQLFFLLFIFVVVNDWGRYLNTYFLFVLIFTSFFFLRDRNLTKSNINLKNLTLLTLIILYSSSWHMPHCCQKNLGSGLINFKERIFYRINNPTNFDDFSRDFIIRFLKIIEKN